MTLDQGEPDSFVPLRQFLQVMGSEWTGELVKYGTNIFTIRGALLVEIDTRAKNTPNFPLWDQTFETNLL